MKIFISLFEFVQKMEIHNIWIYIVIIAIIVVTSLTFTLKDDEPFTEIYFDNHQNLPDQIRLGSSYPFTFAIHNMEYEKVNYAYSVYVGSELVVDTKHIILEHGESITLYETLVMDDPFDITKVTVKLKEKDQEISFFVRQK